MAGSSIGGLERPHRWATSAANEITSALQKLSIKAAKVAHPITRHFSVVTFITVQMLNVFRHHPSIPGNFPETQQRRHGDDSTKAISVISAAEELVLAFEAFEFMSAGWLAVDQ